MTAPRTRSLLAVLLVLGQLVSLCHALEHAGRLAAESAAAVGAARVGTGPDRVAGLGATDGREALDGSRETSGADHAGDPPCGLCLLAAAGVVPTDAGVATRPVHAPPPLPSRPRGVAAPAARALPHTARGPPPTFV